MAGIDLSCWKVAFNGAEPVRADTIRRFSETFAPHGFDRRAMFPAYGMAEATLLVSAGGRGAGHVTRDGQPRRRCSRTSCRRAARRRRRSDVVGCGRALAGERIAIVDPDSCKRLPPGRVGEIWVSGPNVARGYWRNAGGDRGRRSARDRRREDGATGCAPAISAFSMTAGELFITGRIKDIIIIRGINHYPQDIEDTVQGASGAAPAWRRGLHGAGRARRGSARHRSGGRAHRAQPHRCRRDDRADPRGRRRPSTNCLRGISRCCGPAPCRRPPAARSSAALPAGSGSNGSSRILRQARTDQKSIFAALPSLMLAAIPSDIWAAGSGDSG